MTVAFSTNSVITLVGLILLEVFIKYGDPKKKRWASVIGRNAAARGLGVGGRRSSFGAIIDGHGALTDLAGGGGPGQSQRSFSKSSFVGDEHMYGGAGGGEYCQSE